MSFYFKIHTVEKKIICPLQPLKKTKTKIKKTYHIVIITSRK